MAHLESLAHVAELNGVLLVRKPTQLSTHDLIKSIKSHFNLVKVDHGGTLEPFAEGLVVLLLGEATRFASSVRGNDLSYQLMLQRGLDSDTGFVEAQREVPSSIPPIDAPSMEKLRREFSGDIFLTPRPFTLIKRGDHASYDVIETPAVEQKTFLTHVYRLRVNTEESSLLSVEVRTTKNFDVCAFAHEVGVCLGCGAALKKAVRTACGQFDLSEARGFMELMKMPPHMLQSHVRSIPEAFGK